MAPAAMRPRPQQAAGGFSGRRQRPVGGSPRLRAREERARGKTGGREWRGRPSATGQDGAAAAAKIAKDDLLALRKNEEWRFSATTLGRILGDEPRLDSASGDASGRSSSFSVEELAEVFPEGSDYRQIVVRECGVVFSEAAGGGSVTVTTGGEARGEAVLASLREHDARRREDPECPKPHFFDGLRDGLSGTRKGEHLVIQVPQRADHPEADSEPTILHISHVVPKKRAGAAGEREGSSCAVCWAPQCSVVVESKRSVVVIEEFVYETGADADAKEAEGSRVVLPKTRILLHSDASLKHLLVHGGSEPRDVVIRTLEVTQAERSTYNMVESRVGYAASGANSTAAGGSQSDASLSRLEVDIWQTGAETTTTMDHLSLIATPTERSALAAAPGITHELRTKARLNHPGAEISQVAKMVASGSASHCIFDGRVDIEKEAQQTDAAQIARGILMTRRATINARPNLRIQADDVAASHGCTIADLEEDQIFYMASRGIEEKDARAVLIGSFISEITSLLADFPKLSGRVTQSVEKALSQCDI